MKPQYWKKIISIVFVAIFIVSVVPSHVLGQTGTQKADDIYREKVVLMFNRNDLSITHINGFDTVRLAGDITYLTTPGQPELPVQQLYVTLPDGVKANKIFVNNVENQNLPGSYIINPAQPPQTMMDAPGTFIAPDPTIYTYNQPWPSHLVTLTDQITLEGKNIAVVEITPLQYTPSEKTLSFASSITFTVEGTIGAIINTPPPQTLSLEPGSYHYVIITQESWMSNFQPLADWRIQRGITTKIVGRDWIYSTYTGTNQAKIRAFIIDAKNTWGTTSFLFGGDVTIIPYYIQTISGFPDGNKLVCCDTYYANTDSDFYTSEVWVGRAPVTTTTEITTFINKIFTYEKNPPTSDYVKKVGLFGFDFDDTTDAEDVKIYIDNYYIPTNYTMSNVYDSDTVPPTHKQKVIDAVNAGQNILNHMDHSDYYIMGTGSLNHGWSLTFSDVNAFTNTNKQSIIYSVGCWAAAYDYNPCIAEKWMLNPNGGAVAFIGNTRYGWYQVGNPQADSGYYDRLFFQAIFSEHRYTLGDAFTDSKNSFHPNDPYYRYVFAELTLLGDPELRLWNENPESMVVTHPSTLPIGTSSFTVHVEKTNGVDIQGALVVLWKGTEVYLTGTTNVNGDVTLTPSPSTAGTMLVTVTKRNYIPYEGSATVLSGNQPPYVPSSPVPSNGATGVSINTDLSWTGGDPDAGDTVTYDVYFGTVSPPPKVIGNQTGTTYNLPTLAYNTHYYWKIVAWDNHQARTLGPLWSFTTEQPPNNPPYTPSTPNPPNGATDVLINTDLSWTGGDPDTGDTVTYSVYFGTNSPPPKVVNNQSANTYDPGTLNYETTYYWKIISWDNHGASTAGPIWSFTTETTPYYTLEIIIEGNGSVQKNPDQPSYPAGTPVELTAFADLGWRFDQWSGDLQGNQNPSTIIMNSNKVVTAHFMQEQYTLTTLAQGAGLVERIPDQPSYTYGTVVQLTAYPVPGFWHFDHWEGDVADIYENPTTITMYEDEIVTAYFLPDELTLTIEIIGQGTVLKNPDQETYHINDVVELTAVPQQGWSFVQWGGDHSGTENPTTITIYGPMTITATFSEDQYTLIVTTEGNGHVDKNPDQSSYTYGTPVQLTAIADSGWHFDHWSGDLEGNDNPDTIIMDSNKAVTALFVLDNNPPYIPSNPDPPDGATDVSINTDLSWSGGDPDAGDTVTYNVYFGTTTTPPLISTGQTATTYNLPTLAYNTLYYWQIVSQDSHGEQTLGSLWTFTTEQESGIDPDQSYVTLTNENMPFLVTCPAGDGPAYKHVKVTVKDTGGNPRVGISASEFTFTLGNAGASWYGTLSCTFIPVDPVTDANGEIRFEMKGDTSIVGNITIQAAVQGVPLNDIDTLPCKSPDYDTNGGISLGDFVTFASDYSKASWRSDFTGDGLVSLGDFVSFAGHYGHLHP
jgi:hypothetical protein